MNTKRLLPISGKDMVRVFSKIGFQVERKRGSHIIMSRGDEILVIPDHNPISKGTERELIKDAGLTVEAFNELLKGKK
ncbi:type II toxin-antitoxin system HicA family toxin [Methanogenium sp. S4BF]|uniref:type II toxin-antitoxin system HicA family toxin n=1 Tax=Methanogenium sp. S4BF TaxID=1789226 RepID=UPI002417CA7C|nr:type II toxin-antitoxin system HicA family toxin [Methanogenium sp. S4BF]WFN33694.1 type II toxin-antitoxin system HicA family toxin [Methanogenium sp. S4BF]